MDFEIRENRGPGGSGRLLREREVYLQSRGPLTRQFGRASRLPDPHQSWSTSADWYHVRYHGLTCGISSTPVN